jgi:hypothetical protein
MPDNNKIDEIVNKIHDKEFATFIRAELAGELYDPSPQVVRGITAHEGITQRELQAKNIENIKIVREFLRERRKHVN